MDVGFVVEMLPLAQSVGDSAREAILDANILVAAGVAFVAGLVSFASPCILPLVPGYLSYMTGLSGDQISDGSAATRSKVLVGSVLFVLGFGIPFMLLGAFSSAVLGTLQRNLVVRIGMGVLVAVLGVLMARGILSREIRVADRAPDGGVLTAPLLGFVFGVGWTPCVGPALAAIITIAGTAGGAPKGAFLGMVFALGIGLPFALVGVLFARLAGAMDFMKRNAGRMQVVGGAFLALVGVAIATGLWDQFIIALRPLIGGFEPPI